MIIVKISDFISSNFILFSFLLLFKTGLAQFHLPGEKEKKNLVKTDVSSKKCIH